MHILSLKKKKKKVMSIALEVGIAIYLKKKKSEFRKLEQFVLANYTKIQLVWFASGTTISKLT